MKRILIPILGLCVASSAWAAPTSTQRNEGIVAVVMKGRHEEALTFSDVQFEREVILFRRPREEWGTPPPLEALKAATYEAYDTLITRKLAYFAFLDAHPEATSGLDAWAEAAMQEQKRNGATPLPPGYTEEEQRQRYRELGVLALATRSAVLDPLVAEVYPGWSAKQRSENADKVEALKKTEAYQARKKAWLASLREGAFVKVSWQ